MTADLPCAGPPRTIAAWGGVLALAVGLAAAEVVTAIAPSLRSPVLDVGDRVIDNVPAWLKNLAISWFGTNDKIALLVGIASVLLGAAALIGIVGLRRSYALGLVGVAIFGAAGSAAALGARSGVALQAAIPSLVGAVATGVGLGVLRITGFGSGVTPAVPASGDAAMVGRRRVLTNSVAFLATAGIFSQGGRLIRNQRTAINVANVALPGAAGGTSVAVPARAVAASATAPIAGIAPLFTPNSDFYRIDTALSVPRLSTDSWSLRVHGRVDSELELSYDELISRPLIESDITMTCVSNEIGGGLLGTARWLGVRLDDLLAEAGIDPTADQIVGRSSDGWTGGFPVSTLDGRDALIAVAMNGEPLPLEHGFPARLVIPGLYGYVSATKWLTELELTRFDEFDQYWATRGWSALGPIKTQSRIDTPRGLSRVPAGPLAIGGSAWAQTRGIDLVEVQIDDGDWVEANLADEVNDTTWRQWWLEWDATPGRHTVTVRATDRAGEVQPAERRPPMPDGATGHHRVVVLVDEAT